MEKRPGQRLTRSLTTLVTLFALIPTGVLIYLSSPMFDDASHETLVLFARAGIAASLIALVIILLRMRGEIIRNLAPLGAFEEAIKRLSRGDYSHRLKTSSDSEFDRVFKHFNLMTNQLESSVRSSQSVADIDRLILSSADLETVLLKVLLTARMSTVDITLVLRLDMTTTNGWRTDLDSVVFCEQL